MEAIFTALAWVVAYLVSVFAILAMFGLSGDDEC